MTRQNFISNGIQELLNEGITVKLHASKEIDNYGGTFSGEDKEFSVAMGSRLGFETFLHEYSHFIQWKFHKRFFNKRETSCSKVFSWLEGVEYDDDEIKKCILDVIELEWDCERIALDLISAYKLDIDKKKYATNANIYLLFYHAVHKKRKWSKRSIYTSELSKLVPDSLKDLDFYLDPANIDPSILKKYTKLL